MAVDATEQTPLLAPPVLIKPQSLAAQPIIDEEATVPSVESDGDANDEYDNSTSEGQGPDFSVIAVLLLGVFVNNVDSTLVMSQTGSIASEFDDFASAEWLITSFFLASCAAQPVLGKLSDIYGRKTILLVTYAFFTLGNFLTGIGTELWQVLLGRAVAGIGGGAGASLVSILIADLVPIRSVAAWRSYVNVAATTGRSCGGPVGGLLSDTVGWRWSFYGQCPLTILAFILVYVKLPPTEADIAASSISKNPLQSQLEKLRRIDFLGAFILIVATLSFLLGLEFATKNMMRLSPLSISFLAVSIVFVVAFVIVEGKFAREPMFPVRLMLHREVITTYSISFLQMLAQLQLMFSVPLYFQIAMSRPARDAGTRLVPAVVGNAIGGLICGYSINRTGRYKNLTIAGLTFACIGYTLVVIRWHGNTSWAESLYIFPGGFGSAVVQSTTFIALTAGIPREHYAVAGSGLYQAVGIGGTLSTGITMAILQGTLRPYLRAGLDGVEGKEKIIRRAIQDIYYAQTLPDAIRKIVVESYIKALTWTHVSSLVCCALALFITFFMSNRRI